jgi:CubicO group peptidase (beta-lactamase class C family)
MITRDDQEGSQPVAETPSSGLTRREFVTRAAVAVGATAFPFTFIKAAPAGTRDLDAFILQKMHEAKVPGISVAVVRGNEILYSKGFGWANIQEGQPATRNTAYQLASVSKTMTCAGIMTLWEDGFLDLDANINDYLPWEVHIPHAPNVPITMRHLLTHTSAIEDRYSVWGTPYAEPTLYFHGDSPITLGDFERSYLVPGGSEYQKNSNFYERSPGVRYSYSNIAVALAGYIAEVVSGIDFDTLCRQRIMEPLGMTDSGYRLADLSTTNIAMPYDVDAHGNFIPIFLYGYPDYPDGALRTSSVHLARWLGAFMNYGKFQGVRVLQRSTVKEIRRNQIPDIVTWPQGLIWYGDSIGPYSVYGHNGGDYGESTDMFFRPDRGVGVVALTNAYISGRRWAAFQDIEVRLFQEFS